MSSRSIGTVASSGWTITIRKFSDGLRLTRANRWPRRCTRARLTVAGPGVISPGSKSSKFCRDGDGWRRSWEFGRSRNWAQSFITGWLRVATPCSVFHHLAMRAACVSCISSRWVRTPPACSHCSTDRLHARGVRTHRPTLTPQFAS